MLENAVSDVLIQYFIHQVLGPHRDRDRSDFGVILPVDRLALQVLQLVHGARPPAKDLGNPKQLKRPVLLETLGETRLLLADPQVSPRRR